MDTRLEGRIIFVFTPTQGSWLNIIEGFFDKMSKLVPKGIWVNYKKELSDRIYKYFDEFNRESIIYHWTYKLDEICVDESAI